MASVDRKKLSHVEFIRICAIGPVVVDGCRQLRIDSGSVVIQDLTDLFESRRLDSIHPIDRVAGPERPASLRRLTLTSVHNGVIKQFRFPSDLPTEQTANLSIVVAASRWGYLDVSGLGSDPRYAWEIWPDFAFPARFLGTDGGSINFAGVDEVDYASLPTDGENALNRDLSVGRAIVFPYYCLPPASGR